MKRELSSLPYPVRLHFEQRQARGSWEPWRYRCESEAELRERIAGVGRRVDMRATGIEVAGVVLPLDQFDVT